MRTMMNMIINKRLINIVPTSFLAWAFCSGSTAFCELLQL